MTMDNSKCIYKQCGDYHYTNGTCLNINNKDKHMMECDSDDCEYEEMQALPNEDTKQS